MYAPPAETDTLRVQRAMNDAYLYLAEYTSPAASDEVCFTTALPDAPQWNAVTIACMYGKKSMLLNPRRAVELALLSGTIRRMR